MRKAILTPIIKINERGKCGYCEGHVLNRRSPGHCWGCTCQVGKEEKNRKLDEFFT